MNRCALAEYVYERILKYWYHSIPPLCVDTIVAHIIHLSKRAYHAPDFNITSRINY